MKSEFDQPLKCEVDGDRLVISIGIGTLAWAAKKRNGGVVPNKCRMIDKLQWAKDTADAIAYEDEVGNTILNDMLDIAMERAMNSGSTGIKYPS